MASNQVLLIELQSISVKDNGAAIKVRLRGEENWLFYMIFLREGDKAVFSDGDLVMEYEFLKGTHLRNFYTDALADRNELPDPG